MTSQNSRKTSTSKQFCPKCSKAATGKVIQCDMCEDWFHITCVNISDNEHDVLSRPDTFWLCPTCKPIGKQLFRVQTDISTLSTRFDTLEGTVTTLIGDFAKLLEKFSRILEKQESAAPASKDLTSIVVSSVRDALEAEAKKTTAVLENFQTANDATLLTDVTNLVTTAGFDATQIVSVRRSGPVSQNRRTGADMPRIVKVKCDSESAKAALIKAVTAYSQRGTVSKVRARPDRTWQQREKLRQLHGELQEKRDAGENFWFIDYNVYELKRDRRKFMPRV